MEEVFTLLVQVGCTKNDGLPRRSLGAGILCFTAAQTEEKDAHETVKLLEQAYMNPLDVTG